MQTMLPFPFSQTNCGAYIMTSKIKQGCIFLNDMALTFLVASMSNTASREVLFYSNASRNQNLKAKQLDNRRQLEIHS